MSKILPWDLKKYLPRIGLGVSMTLIIAASSWPERAVAAGLTDYTYIWRIATATDSFRIYPGATSQVDTENPDSCSNDDFYFLDPSHANYEATVSTLTTSYMSGAQVKLYVNGCSSTGRPVVSSVYMLKS